MAQGRTPGYQLALPPGLAAASGQVSFVGNNRVLWPRQGQPPGAGVTGRGRPGPPSALRARDPSQLGVAIQSIRRKRGGKQEQPGKEAGQAGEEERVVPLSRALPQLHSPWNVPLCPLWVLEEGHGLLSCLALEHRGSLLLAPLPGPCGQSGGQPTATCSSGPMGGGAGEHLQGPPKVWGAAAPPGWP